MIQKSITTLIDIQIQLRFIEPVLYKILYHIRLLSTIDVPDT